MLTDEINLDMLDTEGGSTDKATDMFEFEWLSPDADDIETGLDDDLWQFRYKVWF